ncbi:hypothetical protein [Streptomyces sp. NPDC002994]|uniref:hypothetical protein n=1 Tax=Streptomyces sp. NPDC002994 TaxID=3154441 RepID=UPI0033B9DF2B
MAQVGVIEAEVRRRPGVELTQVWHDLRREVESAAAASRSPCGCTGSGWTG